MTHSFWLGNNIFTSLFGGLMTSVIQRKSNGVEPKRDQQVKKLGTKGHIQRSIPRPCMLEGEAFGMWALRRISVCIFKKTCKLAPPPLHPMPCEGTEVGPDHTLELLEVWVSNCQAYEKWLLNTTQPVRHSSADQVLQDTHFPMRK